jgi:hypothetical protein
MTQTDLAELDEITELVDNHRYRRALDRLNKLAALYPDDAKLKALVADCEAEVRRNNLTPDKSNNYMGGGTPKQNLQEVVIVFKSPVLFALVFFLITVLSIVVAWYIIFYVFKFTILIKPALIQNYLMGLLLNL